MNYIRGSEREELLLLPESPEDYMWPDNPVRFIDAFIEQLNLKEAGFARAEPPETGRPPYDPTICCGSIFMVISTGCAPIG